MNSIKPIKPKNTMNECFLICILTMSTRVCGQIYENKSLSNSLENVVVRHDVLMKVRVLFSVSVASGTKSNS